MSGAALSLALAAAVLHATWNLLLARSPDIEAATGVALLAATVVFAPVAAVVWRMDAEAIPYVVLSGLLELAYIALLAAAYTRVPLSIVYPVARGTAPVLILAASAAFLGVEPSLGQVAGIVAVCVGVMLVRGIGGAITMQTLALPLAVACTIAGYTLIDRSGIRHAGAIPYFETTALITLGYPLYLARTRGLAPLRSAVRWSAIAAGVAMFSAYCLVLAALRLAPPGPVAAVRESSVVIATGLAAALLGEQVSRVRLAGAALVAAGVAALAIA